MGRLVTNSAAASEAYSRVVIDAQLKDAGWVLTDGRSVRFEVMLPDGTKADYVLGDRHGRALAVLEAKRIALDPLGAEKQARDYAVQLSVPFVFLANGKEIWFWDHERDAHPHQVKTIFSQPDLERRSAARQTQRDLMSVQTDGKVAGRPYQRDCIDTLCREIVAGRRKMLVEMATGTGKTRTAAAAIKRLFDAGIVTRVLFLVDRIPLARQTEDAFAEYLPDLPAYVKRAGRRFQDEKRITITTLQSMVNDYAAYSSGYFDLIISDECHRSIYGKWSGVLKHFDGLQVGLTATPCVASPEVLAALDDAEDGAFVRDTLRFFELDQPTFRYGLKQAIQEGFLVPYRIYHALTVKTAAAGGFTVSRSELDWTAMDAATKAEFDALFAKGDPITVDPNALERRFTIPARNRAMVHEFRDVVSNGYTASDGVRRFPQDGKTIVFAVTKRHAATLAQMFDDAFADRKPSAEVSYADFVVSDAGADDTANAMDKIKRFKKEPFPRILVSVNMLDTGFDCPEVVNLIMARFTKSAILYQQMRGRGTRRADSIKKTAFTMFDFTGVAAFHGDDEDVPADGGFVVTAEKPDREPRKRSLLALDINDHIDPATRGWVTLDDNGNERHGAPAVDPRAAELGARFEGWLLARSAMTPDRERLLRMVGEVIRANASDLESFEAYHFANDPFRRVGGRRLAERLFGGPAELEALLVSLNEAVFSADAPDSSARPAAQPAA